MGSRKGCGRSDKRRRDGKFDERSPRGKELNQIITQAHRDRMHAYITREELLNKPKRRYNSWIFPHLAKWSTRSILACWGVCYFIDLLHFNKKYYKKITTLQSLDEFMNLSILLALVSIPAVIIGYTITSIRSRKYRPLPHSSLLEEAEGKYGKIGGVNVPAELIVEVAFQAFQKIGDLWKQRKEKKSKNK